MQRREKREVRNENSSALFSLLYPLFSLCVSVVNFEKESA